MNMSGVIVLRWGHLGVGMEMATCPERGPVVAFTVPRYRGYLQIIALLLRPAVVLLCALAMTGGGVQESLLDWSRVCPKIV